MAKGIEGSKIKAKRIAENINQVQEKLGSQIEALFGKLLGNDIFDYSNFQQLILIKNANYNKQSQTKIMVKC